MSDPAVQSNNWFANSIGMILVLFLCTTTFYLIFKLVNTTGDIPENLAFVCGQILGFLTAKLSTTVDWSFGGSSSTKRQGEIIATQANTIAAAQNALPTVPGAGSTVSLKPEEKVVVKAEPEVKE